MHRRAFIAGLLATAVPLPKLPLPVLEAIQYTPPSPLLLAMSETMERWKREYIEAVFNLPDLRGRVRHG